MQVKVTLSLVAQKKEKKGAKSKYRVLPFLPSVVAKRILFSHVLQSRWFISIFFHVSQSIEFIFIFFHVLQLRGSSSFVCCNVAIETCWSQEDSSFFFQYCIQENSSSSSPTCYSREDHHLIHLLQCVVAKRIFIFSNVLQPSWSSCSSMCCTISIFNVLQPNWSPFSSSSHMCYNWEEDLHLLLTCVTTERIIIFICFFNLLQSSSCCSRIFDVLQAIESPSPISISIFDIFIFNGLKLK